MRSTAFQVFTVVGCPSLWRQLFYQHLKEFNAFNCSDQRVQEACGVLRISSKISSAKRRLTKLGTPSPKTRPLSLTCGLQSCIANSLTAPNKHELRTHLCRTRVVTGNRGLSASEWFFVGVGLGVPLVGFGRHGAAWKCHRIWWWSVAFWPAALSTLCPLVLLDSCLLLAKFGCGNTVLQKTEKEIMLAFEWPPCFKKSKRCMLRNKGATLCLWSPPRAAAAWLKSNFTIWGKSKFVLIENCDEVRSKRIKGIAPENCCFLCSTQTVRIKHASFRLNGDARCISQAEGLALWPRMLEATTPMG